MFIPSDEVPEIEAVIAEIKALPPDPSHVHPARQSLAELLRNAPEAPDFDLAMWQQAWARAEAYIKAVDMANDRAEGLRG
jgi:hypothetical protein